MHYLAIRIQMYYPFSMLIYNRRSIKTYIFIPSTQISQYSFSMAANRIEDNQIEITQDQRRYLTHMSFELERSQLYRSVTFFREQSASAKLVLYHNFNQMMLDGVRNVYSCCVQRHLVNEHRETDYLGIQMDP